MENNSKVPFGGGPKKAILVPPLVDFVQRVKERLAEIQNHSPKLHPLFFRVYAGQTGITAAVKAKCLDCCCYQVNEVRLCTAIACPLHAFRPYQKDDEQAAEEYEKPEA